MSDKAFNALTIALVLFTAAIIVGLSAFVADMRRELNRTNDRVRHLESNSVRVALQPIVVTITNTGTSTVHIPFPPRDLRMSPYMPTEP